MVGPSQPIVATLGDDIMLPSHLEAAVDAADTTVEWRTSLSVNKLKHGDISLKLYKAKLSDEGTYRCFNPTLDKESSVELMVVASLTISLMRTEINENIIEVVLQCESTGWYPEPEVFWLDGEGNLLSAGPTETVRGPDDLYTVSSRVTVEKRHSNSFTCRVQQNHTNQTRETHIHVPDDFFSSLCSFAAPISVSLAVVLVVFLAGALVVWKWRRKQNRNNNREQLPSLKDTTELQMLNGEEKETQDVISENTKIKDLDEEKANLDAHLGEIEEKRNDVVGVLNLLKAYKTDLDNQLHLIILKKHDVVISIEESVKYIDEKKNEYESPGTKTNTDTVKKELEKQLQDTDTLLMSVFNVIKMVEEKKKELDKLREEINKQLMEVEEQRDGIHSSL
ncbi:butyrophilin subfamily 1 member A1-like isoform X2 [Sparus aurata]|uniref:Butyrophilin subfamily 1 member A1-like n=1 Tax=Sparus aurata TaxID=8175 RepID=A0A671UTI5_SPAAU|nr:butyrophilin subfamily 1 member A1-like isoform X2 [Sparus aurata]